MTTINIHVFKSKSICMLASINFAKYHSCCSAYL